MITDLKQNTSVVIQNEYEDVKNILDLNPDESEPLMIFDLKGNYSFFLNVTISGVNQEISGFRTGCLYSRVARL